MNKIPCEVVQDLLPSYIDELTSDVSNKMIEDHVEKCDSCRNVLDTMRAGSQEKSEPEPDEKKEIDFLKKNRRKNKIIAFSAIAVIAAILVVLFITRYMIGEQMIDTGGDLFMWDAQVDGNHISLDCRVVNNIYKITGFNFYESDGVVYVETNVVPSGFVASILYGKEFHTEYTAKEPVKQIQAAQRIIWNEGKEISAKAAYIYMMRHPYIGDVSGNNVIAGMANIYNYFGPFMNELQTEQRPYDWKLILTQEIPEKKQEIREEEMEYFAYLLLATVENLDQVTWQYRINEKNLQKTVTADDATAFFGQDIKYCYENVSFLDELISKTGLDCYAFGDSWYDTTSVPDIWEKRFELMVPVVNNSDEGIKDIEYSFYVDGELVESGGGLNADESLFEPGQYMSIWLERAGITVQFVNDLEIEFSLHTTDGEYVEIPGRIRIPSVFNYFSLHDLHITGNSADGFRISQ